MKMRRVMLTRGRYRAARAAKKVIRERMDIFQGLYGPIAELFEGTSILFGDKICIFDLNMK